MSGIIRDWDCSESLKWTNPIEINSLSLPDYSDWLSFVLHSPFSVTRD